MYVKKGPCFLVVCDFFVLAILFGVYCIPISRFLMVHRAGLMSTSNSTYIYNCWMAWKFVAKVISRQSEDSSSLNDKNYVHK